MARVGFDETDTNQPPTKNISTQRARQGQNVKGMIWVLVVSIGLVVAAYAVMLALQVEPVTPGNQAGQGVAPAPGMGGPVAVAPETTRSSP